MNRERLTNARIALPWVGRMLSQAGWPTGAVTGLRATEWFISRSRRREVDPSAWREWVTSAAGFDNDILRRYPVGPCLAGARVSGERANTAACAQPVHLMAAMDHLQLASIDSLAMEEAEALVETLNAHLSGSAMRLSLREPTLWVLYADQDIECETTEPGICAGSNLRGFMPRGRDAAALNRLLTELQMLLHEHPVNLRRRQRGELEVNSIWPWGFGRLGIPEPDSLPELHADDHWLRALWELHGVSSTALQPLMGGKLEMSGEIVLAWSSQPHEDVQESLAALERSLFEPLVKAVKERRGGRVLLHTGTYEFEFAGRPAWRQWLRRTRLERALK